MSLLTSFRSEAEYLVDADATLSAFFAACANNPASCPLASANQSAAQLEATFYDWLYQLKETPLPDGYNTLVRYADIKAAVREVLNAPASWANFSGVLAMLYQGDTTGYFQLVSAASGSGEGTNLGSANIGIRGVDKTVRVPTLEEYMPNIERMFNSSHILGDLAAYSQIAVTQWKATAVEIYAGDFRAKTKNPVLIASNSFDPQAPIRAAQRLSGLLEGSAVLVNNGYGVSGHWCGI